MVTFTVEDFRPVPVAGEQVRRAQQPGRACLRELHELHELIVSSGHTAPLAPRASPNPPGDTTEAPGRLPWGSNNFQPGPPVLLGTHGGHIRRRQRVT